MNNSQSYFFMIFLTLLVVWLPFQNDRRDTIVVARENKQVDFSHLIVKGICFFQK